MEKKIGHYIEKRGYELSSAVSLMLLGEGLFLINTRGHGDSHDNMKFIHGRFGDYGGVVRFMTYDASGLLKVDDRPVDEINVVAFYELLD